MALLANRFGTSSTQYHEIRPTSFGEGWTVAKDRRAEDDTFYWRALALIELSWFVILCVMCALGPLGTSTWNFIPSITLPAAAVATPSVQTPRLRTPECGETILFHLFYLLNGLVPASLRVVAKCRWCERRSRYAHGSVGPFASTPWGTFLWSVKNSRLNRQKHSIFYSFHLLH